jgi:N-acyl-D-amino-acid deacylase
MVEVVRASVKAGAVGFSTSRNPGHRLPDGRSIPGTYALPDELAAIAKAVGEHDGLMQTVMNMSDFEGEMALLREEAACARVLFSHFTGPTTRYGDKVEAKVMAMRDDGLDVNAMIIPRSSGFIIGLQAYLPWQGGPWDELGEMDFEQRLAAIQKHDFQARLLDHAKEHDPQLTAELIFPISHGTGGSGESATANYVGGPSESLKGIADKAGEHPAESFIRISSETDGKTFFTMRHFNQNLDALAKALSSDFCLPGLGDAGAHVRQVMDSGWTTFVMSYWHRDKGLFSLPEVVQQLTSAPARIIGLRDRGTLVPGKKADLNVIKLAALSECIPELVHDLPSGAQRLTQRARGYRATICNGQIILEHDRLTSSCAGSVLRNVVE